MLCNRLTPCPLEPKVVKRKRSIYGISLVVLRFPAGDSCEPAA